jgi:hypothetical protein
MTPNTAGHDTTQSARRKPFTNKPDSIHSQPTRDLECTKWQQDLACSQYFCFPCQYTAPHRHHNINKYEVSVPGTTVKVKEWLPCIGQEDTLVIWTPYGRRCSVSRLDSFSPKDRTFEAFSYEAVRSVAMGVFGNKNLLGINSSLCSHYTSLAISGCFNSVTKVCSS